MKNKIALLLAASILLALTGCNDEKDEKPVAEIVQTVDWYKAHKAERAEVLARCRNNPGELAAAPNCINASRADSSSTWSATGGGINTPAPLTAKQINGK